VNLLTGLLKPTAGVVRFKGHDIAGIGPVMLAQARHGAGLPARAHLPGPHRGADDRDGGPSRKPARALSFFRSIADDSAVNTRVREIAAIFGLDGKLDSESRLLSQGEKKLLDIASAFALSPEVILLDEPTSGVSSADKHGIMKTLVDAAKRAGREGDHPGRARHGPGRRLFEPHRGAAGRQGAGRPHARGLLRGRGHHRGDCRQDGRQGRPRGA
jgi:branched-chain amino acid transport system ATP-binding protein